MSYPYFTGVKNNVKGKNKINNLKFIIIGAMGVRHRTAR